MRTDKTEDQYPDFFLSPKAREHALERTHGWSLEVAGGVVKGAVCRAISGADVEESLGG